MTKWQKVIAVALVGAVMAPKIGGYPLISMDGLFPIAILTAGWFLLGPKKPN